MMSPREIYATRKAWARGLLILSWGRVEALAAIQAVVPAEVRNVADEALRDAVAIAEEWGVDCKEAIESAGAAR